MTTESDFLQKAQQALMFESVLLRDSKINMKESIDVRDWSQAKIINQSLSGVYAIKHEEAEKEDDGSRFWIYTFFYETGIRCVPEQEEADSSNEDYQPFLEIRVKWSVRYWSKSALPEESLHAFSVDNVGYHVWPYWREYVQSTSARMGLVDNAPRIPLYTKCTK
ncbi:MAG: hypothetical protein CMI08_03245 [Oceanospirillaceae bacterium]|uniref:hypothetical protein n=1 Tax=unclassified Thalassolituus TaxID=2624967 RepID=UPI000C0A236A|nr:MULTISPECIES: hypothetical protein [unclassified Thalassolituus]MAK92286.1 hypothetical protein [Thalassolituus sp.]MAX98211.1 hypothetical protein [Oceanospirillaceae bacterium]MBL33988.1 hypothetical protein [Oceanospirillaceae bacterium]MBS54211.1 hypothetical protein [Oceanospirillaceae bacterium]|tara:strand:- start:54 stop:548 length:495 start_codon:yes stop_codon:yes gene_type:complete